jgi:hypothetical protein
MVVLLFVCFLLFKSWWHITVITVLGRLRQNNVKFKAGVNHVTRPCLKKKMLKRRKARQVRWWHFPGLRG